MQNTELICELVAMQEIGVYVSDNALNHAACDDLTEYAGMSVGDLASLFCEVYNAQVLGRTNE